MLSRDAVDDIFKAIEYYKKVSPSVAAKFLSALNNSFTELKKNPFYQIRYDNVRIRTIKKFPYLLHFVVAEKQGIVEIYGIRLSAQNPDSSHIVEK